MKVLRRPRKAVRIEMLPLIDIVFLLLIFFIYAMLSMAVHRGLELDLPQSNSIRPSDDSHYSISIRKVGDGISVYVDKQEVSIDELGSLLNQKSTDQKDQPVLVFADQQVSYQQLFSVLDALQQAGFTEISLQAKKK